MDIELPSAIPFQNQRKLDLRTCFEQKTSISEDTEKFPGTIKQEEDTISTSQRKEKRKAKSDSRGNIKSSQPISIDVSVIEGESGKKWQLYFRKKYIPL